MTSRRAGIRQQHPALPKAPERGIRLCIDFFDIYGLMQFMDLMNKGIEPNHEEAFHMYKLDYFDINSMPLGNHYYMAIEPDIAQGHMELTKEIIIERLGDEDNLLQPSEGPTPEDLGVEPKETHDQHYPED